jgi:uncharacterized membrane-anchored protein
MRSVHLALLVLALALAPAVLWRPDTASAQIVGEITPRPFQAPLALTRGVLNPIGPGAEYFSRADSCHVLRSWGWKNCMTVVDAMVSAHPAGIATLVVEKPRSEGHVNFDSWDASDRSGQINRIWEGFVADLRKEAKKSGSMITPSGWTVEPTLDRKRHVLFYALAMQWDGHTVVNAKAAIFDRRGYVVLRIVPVQEMISPQGLTSLVQTAAAAYRPAPGQAYDDFAPGDAEASDGALGALADMVDVTIVPSPLRALLDKLSAAAPWEWIVMLLLVGSGTYLLLRKKT